jgi:DNA polymerase type B, organellar and viral
MPKGVQGHNYATKKANTAPKPFVGVDGEGGNVAESGTLFGTRHQYLSLRAGSELLETGSPLTPWECFDFLCSLPRNTIPVSYFFDYDVTMMISMLPMERAQRLLTPRLREVGTNGWSLPVDVTAPDGTVYQLDYLPHKEFRVRRAGETKWYIISDVGQFFQTSFLKTLEKWDIGTPEEREMIRVGKEKRATFEGFTDETRAYNALECLLLEQLMEMFRIVCEETGYVPRKWQGPGYLASAMLERHHVPRRDEIPILSNQSFRALAQAAYYGGRFETTAAGPIRRRVFQYDINGAYVHLLRSLPCLIHGSWRQVHDRPAGGTWFGQIHFDHPGDRFLYNLPVRLKNGNIHYPKESTGVYWSTELEAAERAGTTFEFESGWEYESHCDCRWFDFVDAYYAERVRLGKSAKGYVLKLAGNSIYGKLAQSIGYAPWANPVWAGLITAGCRAMLINAYAQAPDQCYMLATDGLFMGRPLDVKISKELGEWEETIHEDGIFIVQPGIYYTGAEAKSRGVERGRIGDLRPLFEEQWVKFIQSGGVDHTVPVPVQNFITAKQAVIRHKWQLAGTWTTEDREISFIWANKRKSGLAWDQGDCHRSFPPNGDPDHTSVPYARQIGGGLRVDPGDVYSDPGLIEAERMREQPDWVEPLFDTE